MFFYEVFYVFRLDWAVNGSLRVNDDHWQGIVTAYITNNLPERFEHAMLKFDMPLDCDSIYVTGGTLLAVETLETAARCYVGVDIQPSSLAEVTVRVDSCAAGGDTTDVNHSLGLARNSPNPFGNETLVSFTLPSDGQARIAIYDIRGREVRVLVDGTYAAGPHSEPWDGKDGDARPVSSGIYFARLTFAGQDRVQKMVVAR